MQIDPENQTVVVGGGVVGVVAEFLLLLQTVSTAKRGHQWRSRLRVPT